MSVKGMTYTVLCTKLFTALRQDGIKFSIKEKEMESLSALLNELATTITDAYAEGYEMGAAAARAGLQDVCTHPDDADTPEHWAAKPFARLTYVEEHGDPSVGQPAFSFWAFAEPEHQKGTVLADLVELADNVKSLYKAACESRGASLIEYGTDFVPRKDVDAIAGAFGCEHG